MIELHAIEFGNEFVRPLPLRSKDRKPLLTKRRKGPPLQSRVEAFSKVSISWKVFSPKNPGQLTFILRVIRAFRFSLNHVIAGSKDN